jgi:hypothetical protein
MEQKDDREEDLQHPGNRVQTASSSSGKALYRRVKHLALTAEGRRLRQRVETILSSAPGLSTLPAADQAALQDLLERSLASG